MRDANEQGKKLEHTVSAVMSVAGLGNRQKVTLDGTDISRYVQRVQFDTMPGELARCVLFLLLTDGYNKEGIHYPEQLMNVVLVDDYETKMARILLESAVRWLCAMWEVDADNTDTWHQLPADQLNFLMRCNQHTHNGPTPMMTLGQFIKETRVTEPPHAD